MRVCKHCGASIEHRNIQALYCSDTCKFRYKCAEYYKRNKDKLAEKNSERYKNFTDSQYQKLLDSFKTRYHRTKCTGKWTEKRAKRHAEKLLRTPKWLSEWDHFFIQEIYSLSTLRSQVTKIPHEVDHIIPMQGKFVSGLHVPNNLQILTRTENRRKRNEYNGEREAGKKQY